MFIVCINYKLNEFLFNGWKERTGNHIRISVKHKNNENVRKTQFSTDSSLSIKLFVKLLYSLYLDRTSVSQLMIYEMCLLHENILYRRSWVKEDVHIVKNQMYRSDVCTVQNLWKWCNHTMHHSHDIRHFVLLAREKFNPNLKDE